MNKEQEKDAFFAAFRGLTEVLGNEIRTKDGQWTIKGFIDVYRSIYTISSDTKIVSKVLEIHLFPKLLAFAEEFGFGIVLADHQNYYPDISFVKTSNPDLKFAVDLKTTYRRSDNPDFCNGFTFCSDRTVKYFTNFLVPSGFESSHRQKVAIIFSSMGFFLHTGWGLGYPY